MAEAVKECRSSNSSSRSSTPEVSWRGAPLDEVYRQRSEYELEHVAPVCPSETHTVLYHFPIRTADNEPPRPLKATQKWDAQHVRLPCSAKSQYPVTAPDGSASIEQRWAMIENALLRPINNSHELEAAILSYNSKYAGQWHFRALHCLFEEELDESETCVFFEDLLPRIIRLALRLPQLIQAPIPLLTQGRTHSISLTQQQVACLLANAFLCTYPRRNTLKRKSEYGTFPDINFNRLFQSSSSSVLEKIKCICHYFRRVCPTERDSSNVPSGVVTFTRRSMSAAQLPNWTQCEALVGGANAPLHITSVGTIEDQGIGLLQVDFANKYLGGGVLGGGCVQEEIRFVICPELFVSKLFTECLRPTEVLLMVGCERYSNYEGYASTFRWSSNHEDATPRDSSRRRLTHIVAIDALSFREPVSQFRQELMLRELNKAYVGFFHPLDTPAPGVASGNWGCGAFGGDASLKALLQLMVCAAIKRPLVYFTFCDVKLRDDVHKMVEFLRERNVRVCGLWDTLRRFKEQQVDPKDLYNFIYNCHGDNPPKRSPYTQLTLPQMLLNKSKASQQRQSSTFVGQTEKHVVANSSSSNCDSVTNPSGCYSPTRMKRPSATMASSNTQDTRIIIEDYDDEDLPEFDSDTDAVLLAAVETAEENQPLAPPRQRTALEMLNQEGTPASKRLCDRTSPRVIKS